MLATPAELKLAANKLKKQKGLRQIHLQDGHGEGIGDLALVFIAVDGGDELLADIDLHRIIDPRSRLNPDLGQVEFFPQISLQAAGFLGVMSHLLVILRLCNAFTPSGPTRKRQIPANLQIFITFLPNFCLSNASL